MIEKFIYLFLFIASAAFGSFPVAHEGRFHPDDVYRKQMLYEYYHTQSIKKKHRSLLEHDSNDPVWDLHFNGPENTAFPLLFVQSAELKNALGLKVKESHFSFTEINQSIFHDPQAGRRFASLLIAGQHVPGDEPIELNRIAPGLWVKGTESGIEILSTPKDRPWSFLEVGAVIAKGVNKKAQTEAESLLGKLYRLKRLPPADDRLQPLHIRLQRAGDDFKALPYRAMPGKWISLRALAFDVSNFTPYPDDLYVKLKAAYEARNIDQLTQLLNEGYQTIAGQPYLEAEGKALTYPSTSQLQAESLLYSRSWLIACAALYALSFLSGVFLQNRTYMFFAVGAFLLHTAILVLRCYVLERPPVSNMFETVIYVPWVAMLGGFLLQLFSRERWLILSASVVNVLLLILLEITQLNQRLDNVQAVLDSQYWLTVHVLMVVGSYGMFALAGVLGHFYLISRLISGRQTDQTERFGRQILQAMYLGTALLIPGTILGGVWAAESWGRFWDWDPKESWAFISSCVYLIWIHAYRFGHIRYDGLAVGSIVGLMVISFTWYGVNYILGTGLHSYGFGSGGEIYYYLYLAGEAAFIAASLFAIRPKTHYP